MIKDQQLFINWHMILLYHHVLVNYLLISVNICQYYSGKKTGKESLINRPGAIAIAIRIVSGYWFIIDMLASGSCNQRSRLPLRVTTKQMPHCLSKRSRANDWPVAGWFSKWSQLSLATILRPPATIFLRRSGLCQMGSLPHSWVPGTLKNV